MINISTKKRRHYRIRTGIPLDSMRRIGRPIGSGENLKLLSRLTPGDRTTCVIVDRKKKNSIRTTAYQQGMKIVTRQWPGGGYAIWRET